MIVAPSLFRRQTASQQAPFHFGGSQVPLHLGMTGGRILSLPKPKSKQPNLNNADFLEALRKSREKKMSGGRMPPPPPEQNLIIPPPPQLQPQRLTAQTRAMINIFMGETIELLQREAQEYGNSQELMDRMNEYDRVEPIIREVLETSPTEAEGQQIIRLLNSLIDFPH